MKSRKNRYVTFAALFAAAAIIITGGATFMARAAADGNGGNMGSKGISPVTGTFIQPWLYNGYTDERWEQEFSMMEEMGIEYIIMGDTLSCQTGTPITDTSKWVITANYATLNSSYKKGRDVLTPLFERCKAHGIKLYVGMGNTPAGWPYLDESATGFKEISEMFADVAEDLYNAYYDKFPETFAGFYFVPELYNSSAFDSEARRTNYVNKLSAGFHTIFNKITELNSSLPFIFSPYVNMFGGSWVSKNTDNIGLFWKELLANAGFRDGDILCPQDSVGAGGADLELLEPLTKAYKYAVDNCGKEIHLWSNCEIFVQPKDKFFDNYDGNGSYWTCCTVDRMVKQFEIVSKYVERIFCFAVPHYLSPYNTVSGYYDSYKYYLENGELDSVPPKAPKKFRTLFMVNNGVKCLTVSWSGMYDNLGVHRVNIYKNGEFYTFRASTRNEGGSNPAVYPNSFYDIEYTPDTAETVVYEFEVIDCSGNVSERSQLVVEPGSVPNKVRAGASYSGPIKHAEGAIKGAEAAAKKALGE
ncbi:MAG: DUF4434 domain-containing protein [Clostridia bacterium]|nr:DUF4434 domain-containing protein [Clostridia bacterium]